MIRALAALLPFALSLPAAAAERLSLGTWNMEWMMLPATFDALAPKCFGDGRRASGGDRALPCNVVKNGRWSEEDLARIREFAAQAAVDVIALQETDGRGVASEVFPDREFCFTKRKHVQNVGFAIRRGLPYRCNTDYYQLGLEDNDVRWGADLTLFPGTQQEMRLLAVHLKSGCNRDPLTDPRSECRTLQEQVPVLEAWIDRRAKSRVPFAVLGDFNRRFDRERDAARDARDRTASMWPELDDGEPAESDLVDAGADFGAIGCGTPHGKRPPIDHIVLNRSLGRRIVAGSYRAWEYPAGGRWPDHCLISVELELEGRHGL